MGRGSGNPVSSWRATLSPDIGYLSIQRDSSSFHSRSDSSESISGIAHIGGQAHTNPSAHYTGVGHIGHHPNPTPSNRKPHLPRDTPYIPPRHHQSVTPQAYTYPGPHATHSYDPLVYQDPLQSHLYGGNKPGPSESQLLVESNHSAGSTASSSSGHRITQKGYCGLSHSQSPVEYTQHQVPLPRSASQRQPYCHYSAYQGRHRVGLETVNYGDHLPNTPGTHCCHVTFPGYPLSNILAPETFDQLPPHKRPSSQMGYLPSPNSDPSTSTPHHQGSAPTFSISPPATTSHTGRSLFPDAGPYLRQQLGIQPHEPVNLWSLSDPPPGEKPNQPYPMLIKLAIYGSPNKQLTLQEIYSELEKRFTWFRERHNERAWKNSIRHNLSLNKVFRPVPRPITDPGKGSYWQLDVSGGEGYKRARKRRSRASRASHSHSEEDDEEDTSELDDETDGSLPEMRPQPVLGCPSQHSAASLQGMSGSRFPTDNTVIDPELRGDGGHLVGEGRTRPGSRRTNSAGTPYPSVIPSSRNLHTTTPANLDLSSYSQPVWSGQSCFVQTALQSGQAHGQGSGRASSVPAPTSYEYALSVSGVSSAHMPQQTTNLPAIHQPSLGPGLEYGCEPGHLISAQSVQSYADQAQSVSPARGGSRVHSRLRSSPELPPSTSTTTTTSSSSVLSSQSWSFTASSKGKGRAI